MKKIPIRQIRTTSIEPHLSGSFTIRDVSDMLAGKDLIHELHRHDYYYILALQKGKGKHEIDFTSYQVHDHSLFFLRPGNVHQLTLKAGSTGYLIQFKTSFYPAGDKTSGQLLRKVSNKHLCPLDVKSFQRLLPILTSIHQEFTDMNEGYQEVIKAYLRIFFTELVRHRQNRIDPKMDNTPYTQERVDELSELIVMHIAKYKQVAQYAKMMNLSLFQLNAITKASLGKTCSELINEHIILEAKRHLLATSSQVNQIAYHLGYEDASYFIRYFRKHTGYTPEAFRHHFK